MSIKTFTLRLNEEQHNFLEKKSKELGLNKNDYIRQLLENEIKCGKEDIILSELKEIKEMLMSKK